MTYFTGFVTAVPSANRQKYIDHVKVAWPLLHRYGATRMVECWGVDVPRGKVNDLYRAVDARGRGRGLFLGRMARQGRRRRRLGEDAGRPGHGGDGNAL